MSNANKLWESHRIVLPEAREVMISECRECRFFVSIKGAWETRRGCVGKLKLYHNLSVRVPATIPVMELIKAVGREGLDKIPEHNNPFSQACSLFLPKQCSKVIQR
jgi:hypothetical protein